METLYIVDNNDTSSPFRVLNTATKEPDGTTWAHYSEGESVEDYIKRKHADKDVSVLTYEEIEARTNAWAKKKAVEFSECTKEEWWDLFECLPPCGVTHFEGGMMFYLSEAYTGYFHTWGIKYRGKYYQVLRSRYDSPEDIYNDLITYLKQQGEQP